jgi:HK97 family phage major capsid protein
MLTMPALLEQRAKLKTDAEAALASGDDAKAAQIVAELDALMARISTRAKLDEMDRTALARPVDRSAARVDVRGFGAVDPAKIKGELWRAGDGSLIPVLDREQRLADMLAPAELPESSAASQIGLGGLTRAMVLGPRSEIEKRALAEATAGAGGVLVPTPLAASVIDRLRAVSRAVQAGVRTVPMSTQTLKMARITTDPTVAWRAENASIAESDPAFDSVTLTAKSLACFFKVSRELVEDAPNLDAALRNVLAQSFAVALDAATLVGSGASNQPLGIRGTSGITSVSMGGNGAALGSWSPVLDAVRDLQLANAGTVSAMIASPRTARTINGFADTTNQPLQRPPAVADVPLLTTTAMPVNETQGTATNASTILVGDFAEVMVGIKTDFTLSVLQERFADSGQIAMVGWLRADVAVARPAALARIIGIIP